MFVLVQRGLAVWDLSAQLPLRLWVVDGTAVKTDGRAAGPILSATPQLTVIHGAAAEAWRRQIRALNTVLDRASGPWMLVLAMPMPGCRPSAPAALGGHAE